MLLAHGALVACFLLRSSRADSSLGRCYNRRDTSCLEEALVYDDSQFEQSVSLLQHAATVRRSGHIASQTEGVKRQVFAADAIQRSHRLDSAWPMAIVDFRAPPAPDARKAPIIVVTPPLSYRITLGFIVLLLVVAVAVFFITEKKRSKPVKEQELAKPLSSDAYLDRGAYPQQTVQDFIDKSDRLYLISVNGKKPLTYERLKAFISSKEADVSRFGVAGRDRLAAILGDGPEGAVAFWAFSAQCTFCPISHRATDDEIAFTLQDLPAKAVVAYREDLDRIKALQLPQLPLIIECILEKEVAGLFSLEGKLAPVERQPAQRQDIALVIQTTGTTKKPKLVPLTHENLILCALTIKDAIGLNDQDRSLHFLPLHRVGGLANHVIAPVVSHSCVVCADEFDPRKAFHQVMKHRPTWYYGSPTAHMLMMSGKEKPADHRLRLIRNSTAALLPKLADEMTFFWGCEILPAYGMSECTPIASHQTQKLMRLQGVGPAAAPEIKIDGSGEEGDICIRGPSVFSGYEYRSHMGDENPNTAFRDGWFYTGDRGRKDKDDYYFLTGRSKDIIIRGGENLSPFEIEDAIQDPQISEKAVFSVNHTELGEVVGLAVVTSEKPLQLSELLRRVRKSAQEKQLAVRKLPDLIVSVDKLEKDSAGKLKRSGLQKLFGLPVRSLNQVDYIAYTFRDGRLKEIELQDQDDDGDKVELDSLGLARQRGAVEMSAEIKDTVMVMYACVAFCVVAYHGQLYIQYPRDTSSVGIACVHMMAGNVVGGMRWTMQCFMGCASLLQCKEPFSATRVLILVILYFGFQCPWANIVYAFSYWVSREPVGSFYVLTDKRWFLGVLIISYCSFAFMRHLPYHGLQCLILVVITACLNIWPVNNGILSNNCPSFLTYWFELRFVGGLYFWVGCIMVYYIAGYYGHDVVARVAAHPLAGSPSFQRKLRIGAPILFLVFLFAMMLGPQMTLGMHLEYLGYSWKWNPSTVFMDQFAGLAMIFLLFQCARNLPRRIKDIGAYSLGIYLGGDIALFCPYGPLDHTSASFGIIVDKYIVLPTMQSAIDWAAFFWPLMVIIVFLYNCFQISVFGLPFHELYLKLKSLIEFIIRKVSQRLKPG